MVALVKVSIRFALDLKDKRGAILVQTVVILPILVLVVFGGFEVWKVMSVKQSLTSGTAEAARYLSFNPDGKDEAEEDIIYEELLNNDLVGDTPFSSLDIKYYYGVSDTRIWDPATVLPNLPCEAIFSMETELRRLPWDITIPGLSSINLSITTERQVGKIFCTQ
jgi:hypothetical protein